MKCEKCGNEYTSQYYFSTPTTCNDCFKKLSAEEQNEAMNASGQNFIYHPFSYRVTIGKRFGAALIDAMILLAITGGILYFTGFIHAYIDFSKDVMQYVGDQARIEILSQQFFEEHSHSLVFTNLVYLMYFVLEIMIATSIGKMILGIQIGNEDRRPANSSQLVIRYVIKFANIILSIIGFVTASQLMGNIGTFVFIVIVIGFFFVFGQKRQAFHDMAAKTAIFHKQDILEDTDEQSFEEIK